MTALRDLRQRRWATWTPPIAVVASSWRWRLPVLLRRRSTPRRRRILALAYVVMALGLNIVVGFAGPARPRLRRLLRLRRLHDGLVRRRASPGRRSTTRGSTSVSASSSENLPGIHLNFLLIVIIAIAISAIAGVMIGLPTLRLRGDYIAIVTLAFGEIIGRVRQNGDEITIRRLQAHQRPPGDLPGRPDRPADLERLRPHRTSGRTTGRCSRMVPGRAVRELPPARLAPGPRLDRAARGRGGGRSMGVPLVQDQADGLRDRRAFGGIAGAFLGVST